MYKKLVVSSFLVMSSLQAAGFVNQNPIMEPPRTLTPPPTSQMLQECMATEEWRDYRKKEIGSTEWRDQLQRYIADTALVPADELAFSERINVLWERFVYDLGSLRTVLDLHSSDQAELTQFMNSLIFFNQHLSNHQNQIDLIAEQAATQNEIDAFNARRFTLAIRINKRIEDLQMGIV
jgi:hypothetical protein